MLIIYRIFINLILIFIPLIFIFRLIKKKETIISFKEKIGFFSEEKKVGKIIWFHGASVGEIQSIIPLVEKYNKSKKINQILITSNTLSSLKVLNTIKLKKVVHQFFPIDNDIIVKKFLNHWKPSIAFFIDSEIWPNMLSNLKSNNIPSILLNARITKKSFKRWINLRHFSKSIFSNFDLCLSSNKESIGYLKKLGAKNIKYFGNLKYAQSENDKIKISKKLIKFFSNKTTWCASSTHETEEKFAGLVHLKLKKKYKNLLTIIIPRHVERAEEIKDQLLKLNLKVYLHESQEKIQGDIDIYLVNTFGKTKSFYSIIKNVFLGGSLIKHGGQNPLEAVRYNCRIIYGPNVWNFTEIYKFLDKQNISKKINNLNQGFSNLNKLLSSKSSKKNIRNKIKNIGEKILKKNMSEIEIFLK